MYKNQLQELAQRNCFNLPSYVCIREGPDHAPRFKATVTFNGETFESPNFCNTLRQAEHAAAEIALNTLSKRDPSQSLATRILDETGVCKNLLQETAQRAGVKLPVYSTIRSGPGHLPVFTCTVQLAGMSFMGEAAKTKKQAEKNAAMVAWSSLKQFGTQNTSSSQSAELEANEEQEQNIIARALANSCKDSRQPVASSKSQQSIPMQQTSHLQAQQSVSGTATPRIRFIPFEESQGQASGCIQSPYNTAPLVSMEVNDDSTPVQSFCHAQHHGSVILKAGPSYEPIIASTNHHASSGAISEASAFSREAIAANRAAGGIVGNLVRAMPEQIRNVALAPWRKRHEILLPVEQYQRDEEDWFRGEPSRLTASSESHDNNVTEGILPMVQCPFNKYWSRTAQWLSVETQTIHNASVIHTLCAATSLAPPVRIRPMVAVCSAPPRRPETEDGHKNPNDEEATRQVLSQLRI